MKIIGDIIGELVDSGKPLMTPLLKTKVLASRISNLDLLNWVNQEINGYRNGDALPDYRKLRCSIVGTYVNGNYQYNEQPIPTIGLSSEFVDSINSMEFTQSISALESFPKSSENKTGQLARTLAPEITFMLTKNAQKLGNPFFNIINAKQIISIEELNQVIGSIRSKLLDLMLELDKEFGQVTDLNELSNNAKEISDKVTKIMKKTIINAGEGSTITTGNKNKIKTKYKIIKGDIESFKKELRKNKVSEEDINEITSIVKQEQPSATGDFGPKTATWLSKMYQKSVDGTWQIGIATAGGLLVELIKIYFGVK